MNNGLDSADLEGALEALLFVSDEPLAVPTLARLLDERPESVLVCLKTMQASREQSGYGVVLRELAGGWKLVTAPKYHDLLESYVLSWDMRKLTQASLETLAIVAYNQPITRAGIASIRGVNSDSSLNGLVEKGLVREAGSADAPGNPMQYVTTRTFLERFGLKSVDDLPDVTQFAPDEQTRELIRSRLGGGTAEVEETAEEASLFGTVEKIDFDSLEFVSDDDDE